MCKHLTLTALLVLFVSAGLFAADLPAAKGEDVITYLKKHDYQSWQLWPGKAELYSGRHPHGAFLTTYVSKGALDAIQEKKGKIPNGEFIVKENYTPEKKLAAVTVMYKQDGYNVGGGDWYWLKYAPDGTIQKEGKVAGCISCHSSVKNNDWLFTGAVK